MQEYSTIAAVDLGSNSFRLQVARVEGDQLYALDSLRETVRLAAGLNSDKKLDDATQKRALDCLARFGERLRGLPLQAVRVVGTSALRVAKNADQFMQKAEAALGFPIEIVAGREEARLIYLGVAHGLPASDKRRLVVDIGGGSTECIIGVGLEPGMMESLHMGCVNFSTNYFPDGLIDKATLKRAELAARNEIQSVKKEFVAGEWDEAFGSSGTARALCDVLEQNGLSDGGITREGLAELRKILLRIGDVRKFDLPGIKADRKPVLAGGFSIMAALFDELGIEHMKVAEGALREGVLYDLLGRFHHHDMREATVVQFVRRYHVDTIQAARVESLSMVLFDQVSAGMKGDRELLKQRLAWAARLHEIGLSIAHNGYHKHSAYILQNADMPGFSKREQGPLALLVRAQRGSLSKVAELAARSDDWPLVAVLRLAVLFYRSRTAEELPYMQLEWPDTAGRLLIDRQWLDQNPLTEAALELEAKEWKSIGASFKVVAAK
jgi:exopolyphosphatase/guanosine-5'-triphosphate,3'-diphosphate pyrophosphatase